MQLDSIYGILFVGLLGTAYGLVFLYRWYLIHFRFVKTTGIVVGHCIRPDGDVIFDYRFLKFTYEVDGISYEERSYYRVIGFRLHRFSEMLKGNILVRKGSAIRIAYDPAHPQNADEAGWFVTSFWLLSGLPFSLFCLWAALFL